MAKSRFLLITILLLTSAKAYVQTIAERELLDLVNYCRTSPEEFAIRIAIPYIESHNLKQLSESKSLIRALKKQKPLNPLTHTDDLYTMATEYATEMGKKGFSGHRNYSSRFKQNSVKYTYTGENCSYGYDTPVDILMQLLIDQGVPDYGHRKNLLSHQFNYIGIAIQPHKKTTWTCVMNFGGN